MNLPPEEASMSPLIGTSNSAANCIGGDPSVAPVAENAAPRTVASSERVERERESRFFTPAFVCGENE